MRQTIIVTLLAVASAISPAAQTKPDGRDADRAAIRAHIESIFQAFIDGDVEKIFATHSEDWRGFLEGSRTPIRGINEYMRANGIAWPRAAGAPAPSRPARPAGAPAVGYAMKDFDVIFHGPDLAVACFIGEFNRTTGAETTTTNRLRILDVYAKRAGQWIQVSSHTVVDPAWRAETMAAPAAVPPPIREQILTAREAVWRAYFANDRAALEKLIPEEVVAINAGSDPWANRAAILTGAERMAASGTKLTRLEFPKTEMQVYGNGMFVVVYTTYFFELEATGARATSTGRATEMFVRRAGGYVNVGWHLDAGPAQPPGQGAATPPAPPTKVPVESSLGSQYRQIKRTLTRAAEAMPEDGYAFRPVPETRTFAGSLAHVISSNYGYCTNLVGEPAPIDVLGSDKRAAFEASLTTKAQAVKALADSFAFCDRYALGLTAKSLFETYTASATGPDGAAIKLPVERGGLLSGLIAHNNEMYGYLAVYLRLKGIVPPTSQSSGRGGGHE